MSGLIFTYTAAILTLTLFGCSSGKEVKQPVDVQFQTESLRRIGIDGDNRCITWAEDGLQVNSLCDGIWLKLDYPDEGYFHNQCS